MSTTDPYGKDILFTSDFKIGARRDYLTVEGEENLRRAIYRRLLTKPGTYAYRPDYGAGVGTYVKKKGTKAIRDQLRQRIIEQLGQESRIAKVLSVVVEWQTINTVPVIVATVLVQALGREVRFQPFQFSEEAA